ncbi:efflux RND transporter periplasmic adaptor subunit [bacterium]|nr:efflux RND transporter periplasmic adaptor subunit [bacterium]
MQEKKSFFKRRKKFILISGVMFIIALIVFFNFQAQREKAIQVTLEKVQRQDLTSIISASGEVRPKKNVNISAHIAGRIVKIGVEEGERVKAGDFLLKLDSTQYESSVERDKALIQRYKSELIKSKATLQRDKNYYERQKKLYEKKLISEEQLESAKAAYDISKAQHQAILSQVKQAQASLQNSLDNLNKTVYTSPIEGIITSLRVEEGEIALVGTMNNPGTVLMTIADLSVMEVEVEVDETDVVDVEVGLPAEVQVDAFPDKLIKGTVTEVGSSAIQTMSSSEESKDFKVVVTLKNPPPDLKPGLSASADIIAAQKKDVLTVPISALVLREKKNSGRLVENEEEGVFVIEENRVQFQPVEKGIMGEMDIEIQSGLHHGQRVVSGPYSALRQLEEGALVKPEEKSQ